MVTSPSHTLGRPDPAKCTFIDVFSFSHTTPSPISIQQTSIALLYLSLSLWFQIWSSLCSRKPSLSCSSSLSISTFRSMYYTRFHIARFTFLLLLLRLRSLICQNLRFSNSSINLFSMEKIFRVI